MSIDRHPGGRTCRQQAAIALWVMAAVVSAALFIVARVI